MKDQSPVASPQSSAGICKCHSLGAFTMTAAEKKRCRTTCQGAAYVARVAVAALTLIEYEAAHQARRTFAVQHIEALAKDALKVIVGASCAKCMAGAAGLEPATPSLEGSCSVPTELRPRNQDSTASGDAAGGSAHAAQGDPASPIITGLETRAAEPLACFDLDTGMCYRGDAIESLEKLAGRAVDANSLAEGEDLGDVSDHHFANFILAWCLFNSALYLLFSSLGGGA